MNQICKDIQSYGLVPVIKIEDPEKAVPLAKALCDGGLPVAEITFRTKCAAEAISRITKEFPDMLVGAGTVLTTEQVDQAVAAGSKFIVSPGFNPKIVKYCIEKKLCCRHCCRRLLLGRKMFCHRRRNGQHYLPSCCGRYLRSNQ